MKQIESSEENFTELELQRQADALETVRVINDPRLRADEDLEHFTIHLSAGQVHHTPKRRINAPREANKEIEKHLREILTNL